MVSLGVGCLDFLLVVNRWVGDGVHKNHILPNETVEVRKKINYYRLKYVAKKTSI